MITVTYEPPEMVFRGHAGYAPRGRDIVCAAVSALYGTLALADGISAAGGRAVSRSRAGQGAMAVIWGGVEALAEQYPAHVTAVDKRRKGETHG